MLKPSWKRVSFTELFPHHHHHHHHHHRHDVQLAEDGVWLFPLSFAVLCSSPSSVQVSFDKPFTTIDFFLRWKWEAYNDSCQNSYGTCCLELSVSGYKKVCYHHYFQGTSENWTVLWCIRHGLTFLLLPVSTLQHTAPLTNVFWHLTFNNANSAKQCLQLVLSYP